MLWVYVLKLMVQAPVIQDTLLGTLIEQIDRLHLLSPLEIIQTLSNNSNISLGLIKDFMIEKISKERDEMEQLWHESEKYREEIEDMRKKISQLTSSTIVFQASKCEFCRQNLELPTVHFLCKHSYHQRFFDICCNYTDVLDYRKKSVRDVRLSGVFCRNC
jgi:hypothetical protein